MHRGHRLARSLTLALAAIALAVGLGYGRGAHSSTAVRAGVTAPELPALAPQAWLNSPPLTVEGLRGRPVLVEFWTFACSNCRNSLAWMKAVQARYAPRGLAIVAVHSPELDFEHDPAAVAHAVKQLGITYPVLVDNDFRYWNALGNRFWPAFYLVDTAGRIVDSRIGELHQGETDSDAFEREIVQLLPTAPPSRGVR